MTTQQLLNIPLLLLPTTTGYAYNSNISVTGILTVTNSISAGNIGIGTAAPRDKLEVSGNIIPSSCNVYDLGTSNLRFRDLYLSGTSIDLGGILITQNSNQDGIDVKTSSVATVGFKPPIKKLAYRQSNAGSIAYDAIAFIDGDGNACAIGDSTYNRIGIYDVRSPAIIMTLPNNQKAQDIIIMRNNTYIVATNGNTFALGRNHLGQCALAGGASTANVVAPTQTDITNCKKVISTTEGGDPYSVMFLTNDGKVYAAGIQQYGQLGNNVTTTANTLASGPLLTLGPGNTYGNPTTTVLDVIGVGSYDGTNHPVTYCALLSTGTVYCTGYGARGQVGNGAGSTNNAVWTQVLTGVGTPLTNISQITGSGYDSVTTFYALSSTGVLYGWGYGGQGQLGLGNTNNQLYATQITTSVSKMWAFTNAYGSIIIQKTDGLIYGTGYNANAALGLGDSTNRTSFTLISSLSNKNIIDIFPCSVVGGLSHVLARSSDNKLYGAGRNGSGQLGLYVMTDPINTFTEVPFYPTSPIKDYLVNHIDGIGGFSLILTEDGQTYFTGRTRWEYAGYSDRNFAGFCKNTSYLTGKAL